MGNVMSPNLNPEHFRSSPLRYKELEDHAQFLPTCHVAVAGMQGWRRNMEDASCIVSLGDQLCAGVFDGHGTALVAQYCADNWPRALTKELAAVASFSDKDSVIAAFVSAFVALDEQILALDIPGGSTAVCALLEGNTLTIAHCGDSRALLLRSGEGIVELTQDHKPLMPLERHRIEEAGGFVTTDGRVNGKLSCSRSLGDFRFKTNPEAGPGEQMVTCVPEVLVGVQVHPGDVVLLACDGVFEAMTNAQVEDSVRDTLRRVRRNRGSGKKPAAGEHQLSAVASRLLDRSLARGSRDNMTCILVEIM